MKQDDANPATKAEIKRLDGRVEKMDTDIKQLDGHMKQIDGRMDKLDARMDKLDARMDRLEATVHLLATEMREMGKSLHAAIDQVLTVLVNVDKRLTASINNHESRITRLDDHVGIAA